MREYEVLFILAPNLKPDRVDSLTKEIRKALEAEEVEGLSAELATKRPLSYPIRKFSEGLFLIYRFSAQPTAVEGVKRTLKHKDAILRSLFTVKGKKGG